MQSAPIPANDAERLQALWRYDLLDTSAEAEFDDFTVLASHICGTPIALITLIDAARQWFKSSIGLDITETSRDVSFCAHMIESRTMLEVPDTLDDGRFHDNPLTTGEPHVRFYAGAPLVTADGFVVGALCVLDRIPRHLTTEQRDSLSALGRQLMRQVDYRLVSRRLEQQRREQASIVAAIADGLHGLDLDGAIVLQNPAARDMLGARADELIGKPLHETVHHHHADGSYFSADECPIHATLRDGQTRTVRDDVFWRLDGTSFPVEYSVSAVTDDTGARTGAIVAFRDVTERRELERMKSDFVSTISHELRTPLTSIRGALGLVLGGALGEFPDKARAMLESANRNSERLTALVNDMLDLDKLESGTLPLDIRQLDVRDVLQQAIEVNEGYAARHGVQLSLELPADRTMVDADEHRLAQVMANLISNAVKYSPEHGRVEVFSERAADGVRIFVRDHGPGVPDAFRSRIFGRFAQADNSDSRARGGTGLGLSITRAIVNRLNGRIGFDNHPDGGAMFYFTLPATTPTD